MSDLVIGIILGAIIGAGLLAWFVSKKLDQAGVPPLEWPEDL